MVDIKIVAVEPEKDDAGKPWYNVRMEVSIDDRRAVSGCVSIGSDLKAMGDSAQAWMSRSIYAEIAPLSGPKFSQMADILECAAVEAVKEQGR